MAAAEAKVRVDDRGFLYGDGLFETIRIRRGKLLFWAEHMARLANGAAVLGLELGGRPAGWEAAAREGIRRSGAQEAVLRLQVTRGPGPRGLGVEGSGPPSVVMTLHPAPEERGNRPQPLRLILSTVPVLSRHPLNGVKSTSRLSHILAWIEATQAGADEALLLNEHREVVEATSANLFWIADESLLTPPVTAGALPGVARAKLLQHAGRIGLKSAERGTRPEEVLEADAVFLTNSIRGVMPVAELDGRPLGQSPWWSRLRALWNGLVKESLTAGG